MPGKKTTATKNVSSQKKSTKGGKRKVAPKKTATTSSTKPSKKVSPKKGDKTSVNKQPTKKTSEAVPKKKSEEASKKAPKKTVSSDTKQTGGTVTTATKSRTRYFKVVIDGGDPHGRFSGSKPKQAANKALTSILKTMEKDGKDTNKKIRFSIVECTRGSRHKSYNYIGERVELQEPMKVQIGNGNNAKVIEYKYNNKVMKDKPTSA